MNDKVVQLAKKALMGGYDNLGFCIVCCAEYDNVEPDVDYKCDECGALAVYDVVAIVWMAEG